MELGRGKLLEESDVIKVFNPDSWHSILSSGGGIFLVGDLEIIVETTNTPQELKAIEAKLKIKSDAKKSGSILSPDSPYLKNNLSGASSRLTMKPATRLLKITKDDRPLDYRRTKQPDRRTFEKAYRYLDGVREFNYSLSRVELSSEWLSVIRADPVETRVIPLGVSTFGTCLSAYIWFERQQETLGFLCILPPSNKGSGEEDVFMLREFMGIDTNLPEPTWARELSVPDQSAIQYEIDQKRQMKSAIEDEITEAEGRLRNCKQWFRLLYDDGPSLEAVVKESFELLGATVVKTSKEKDDFRLRLASYPETVMEVKGTRNPTFAKGPLRQLAGWMDEANASENIQVKGLFVGNSARNDPPTSRSMLFDSNSEDYAVLKEITVLRSMDLFCLTILKRLKLIDVDSVWSEIYRCKGSFNAEKYWQMLPDEFKLKSNPSSSQGSEK